METNKKTVHGGAAVLGFFIPGLGQLYKGQFLKAVFFFLAACVGYVMFIFPGIIVQILAMVEAMFAE